jgi:hypothetical protein
VDVLRELTQLTQQGSNGPQLVVFNLGYLPGGDKNIVTTAKVCMYVCMYVCVCVYLCVFLTWGTYPGVIRI